MTRKVFNLNVYLTSTLDGADGEVTLVGAEARHAAHVRREQRGARVVVVDGRGRWAECDVADVAREAVRLVVVRRGRDEPPTPRIAVAQALAKDDRLAVELLTQAGADEILPWAASRGVARHGSRAGPQSRWLRWAAEASKQARRSWHPQVSAVASADEVARRVSDHDAAYVCHEEASEPLPHALMRGSRPRSVLLVVGPEGGLTTGEVDRFVAAGAVPVGLGPAIMRAAVAGSMAAAVSAAVLGRWCDEDAARLTS
jgi:16S rRNA (uracil1498-N3)-methyltransferase